MVTAFAPSVRHLRWAFVHRRSVLRVVAVAAVTAVAIGVGLALLDPGPSRTAEGVARSPASAPPRHGDGPPQTIVVVVFDELPLTSLMGPGGRIDAGRYPSFAGLARTATWYRGATAVHDSTALAVPAMLDGRYPKRGLRSDVISHPVNLFTLLAHSYEVNASEEATGLCPTSLCKPLEGTTLSHLGGGKVRRFREFVRSIQPRERPTLWFKHVLLPHVPWQFYPSGRHYRRHAPEPIDGLNGPEGFGDPWLVKVSYQRHLLQLGLADRLLGELLGRVRRLGLFRDALVLVVADHGIGFHVGVERRTVTQENVEDLAPVPLLVKLPGQRRGRISDAHVETIDVLPTILDVARVRTTHEMDGRSLLRPVASQADRVRIFHRVGTRLNTIGGEYSFDPADGGAAAPGGGPPQAGAVRKRKRPGALPHRPAPGARGPGHRGSSAAGRSGHGAHPPGRGAARRRPHVRLRARGDHRRDPGRPRRAAGARSRSRSTARSWRWAGPSRSRARPPRTSR